MARHGPGPGASMASGLCRCPIERHIGLRIDGQRQFECFPEVLLEVVHAGDTAPKLGMECLP